MYYQQRIRNVVSLLIMSMLCLASFSALKSMKTLNSGSELAISCPVQLKMLQRWELSFLRGMI